MSLVEMPTQSCVPSPSLPIPMAFNARAFAVGKIPHRAYKTETLAPYLERNAAYFGVNDL